MTKKDKTKKDEEEDIDILICARPEELPEVLKKSIWAKCHQCGATVWVSISGQKAMKKSDKLKPFCSQCAFAKVQEAGDETEEIQPVPGALEELRKYISQKKLH